MEHVTTITGTYRGPKVPGPVLTWAADPPAAIDLPPAATYVELTRFLEGCWDHRIPPLVTTWEVDAELKVHVVIEAVRTA